MIEKKTNEKGVMEMFTKKNRLFLLVLVILLATFMHLPQPSTLFAEERIIQLEDLGSLFADIAEKVTDSVVRINTTVERVDPWNPFFGDPFFREFFQSPFWDRAPRYQEGFGTGFIVSTDGYIVTNEHVIHGTVEDGIVVELNNGTTLTGKVAWSSYDLDLAVLKVEAQEELIPAQLGDSNSIRPGEWAIAVGNPYGLDHTVTVGVISATGRPLQIRDSNRTRTYKNLIQTDTAINPGNSGGPLLNIKGEVIGINTAINAAAQGIGFAIPINEVIEVVDALKETGEYQEPVLDRPWMGIIVSDVTREIANHLRLDSLKGAIIADVVPNGPTDKAGLKPWDVILEINRIQITDAQTLVDLIPTLEIGEELTLRVFRNGQIEFVSLTLEARPKRYQ